MFKKSTFVIITFIFLVNIFIFNIFIIKYKDFQLQNIINEVKCSEKVQFKINHGCNGLLLSCINEYKNLVIEKGNLSIGAYTGKAIYIKNESYDIPIIEGSFFNDDDFKEDVNSIVIGKKLMNLVFMKDERRYIKFNGIEYRVIGVMGYDDRDCCLDREFYINLNGYLNQKNNNIKEEFKINSSSNDDTNLINDIKKGFSEVTVDNDDNNFFESLITNQKDSLCQAILIEISVGLSVLIISSKYINKKKIEIILRKVYGAKDNEIYIRFIFNYISMYIKGYLVSIVVSLILCKLKIIDCIVGEKLYLSSLIGTLFFVISFGIIISYIFIRKLNKCNMYKGIKETRNVLQ